MRVSKAYLVTLSYDYGDALGDRSDSDANEVIMAGIQSGLAEVKLPVISGVTVTVYETDGT